MDPNTLVSVAEIRRVLTLKGVSLRGIVDKQDLLRALSDIQLDPYDCVTNKNILSAFIRSHGFLAEYCANESDLVARAKQVRSVCLKQGDHEGLKLDLKAVDTILKARDDYQVLEIQKSVSISPRDVLVAFRNVIRQVHPDKNSAQGANQAAARVNQAFERLKNGKSSSTPSATESSKQQQQRYKYSDEADFQRRQKEAEKKWREEDARRRAKFKEEEERRRRQREEEQERRRREAEELRREEERRQKAFEEERRKRAEERKAREEEKQRREKESLMKEKRQAEARVLEEARKRHEEEALRRLAAESLDASQGAKLGEAFKELFPTNDNGNVKNSFASSLPPVSNSNSRLRSKRNVQNASELQSKENQTFMSSAGINSAFRFGASTPMFGQVPVSSAGGIGGVFRFGESATTASSTTAYPSGFSFDINSERVNEQKNERPRESTSFKFGESSTSNLNAPSTFKFGASPESKTTEPTTFKFGASTMKQSDPDVSFKFGSSASNANFKFGSTSLPGFAKTGFQTSSVFQFGNPFITLNSASGFQFGSSNNAGASSTETKTMAFTGENATEPPPVFVFGSRSAQASSNSGFTPNVENIDGAASTPQQTANPKFGIEGTTKNEMSSSAFGTVGYNQEKSSTTSQRTSKKNGNSRKTTTETSKWMKDRERIQSLRGMRTAETPLDTSTNMFVEPVKRKIRERRRIQSLRHTRAAHENSPLDASSSEMFIEKSSESSTTGTFGDSPSKNHRPFSFSSNGVHSSSSPRFRNGVAFSGFGTVFNSVPNENHYAIPNFQGVFQFGSSSKASSNNRSSSFDKGSGDRMSAPKTSDIRVKQKKTSGMRKPRSRKRCNNAK